MIISLTALVWASSNESLNEGSNESLNEGSNESLNEGSNEGFIPEK